MLTNSLPRRAGAHDKEQGMSRLRIGIDIGGTFTDLCVLEEQAGEVFNLKVLSTPAELTRVVTEALDGFFADGRSPDDVTFLFHATTVATNALLRDNYTFEERAPLEVKGKGVMRTYLLTGRKVAA